MFLSGYFPNENAMRSYQLIELLFKFGSKGIFEIYRRRYGKVGMIDDCVSSSVAAAGECHRYVRFSLVFGME